jgi:hypothetical protein
MSSLLSFQLGQQQRMEKENSSSGGLPSPPNSFCGEDSSSASSSSTTTTTTTTTVAGTDMNPTILISEQQPAKSVQNLLMNRRDSLQTVFNDMTIKDYSTSLPENYTIDHSTIRKTPIATATAAATGGLTIRNNNRRQSEVGNMVLSSSGRRKSSYTSRGLSESFSGQYRCNDCGKSYKHPNCLQKHRWEHSEEWEITKNLPLTKHQQVQMLEAAAILVGMDRRIIVEQKKPAIDKDPVEEENESIIIDDEEDEDSDKISIGSNDSLGIFMDDL